MVRPKPKIRKDGAEWVLERPGFGFCRTRHGPHCHPGADWHRRRWSSPQVEAGDPMKPAVFKILGRWLWLCTHHEIEPYSQRCGTWRAAYTSAREHAARCHEAGRVV